MKFVSSNKVRFKSLWHPISHEILENARSGTQMAIARNLESYENHQLIYKQLMKIFTSGEKFTTSYVRKMSVAMMSDVRACADLLPYECPCGHCSAPQI